MSNRRRPRHPNMHAPAPRDLWDDPDAQTWRRRANRELLPMIEQSAVSLTLWPSNGEPDAKIAVELGFTLMLGKPLVFLKPAGATIPPNLARLADEIIEYTEEEFGTPAMAERIATLAKRLADGQPS